MRLIISKNLTTFSSGTSVEGATYEFTHGIASELSINKYKYLDVKSIAYALDYSSYVTILKVNFLDKDRNIIKEASEIENASLNYDFPKNSVYVYFQINIKPNGTTNTNRTLNFSTLEYDEKATPFYKNYDLYLYRNSTYYPIHSLYAAQTKDLYTSGGIPYTSVTIPSVSSPVNNFEYRFYCPPNYNISSGSKTYDIIGDSSLSYFKDGSVYIDYYDSTGNLVNSNQLENPSSSSRTGCSLSVPSNVSFARFYGSLRFQAYTSSAKANYKLLSIFYLYTEIANALILDLPEGLSGTYDLKYELDGFNLKAFVMEYDAEKPFSNWEETNSLFLKKDKKYTICITTTNSMSSTTYYQLLDVVALTRKAFTFNTQRKIHATVGKLSIDLDNSNLSKVDDKYAVSSGGKIIEDFESSTPKIVFTGTQFTRKTNKKNSGEYSGFIGTTSSSTTLYCTTTVKASSVSFYYLTSSEANYDIFRFYIDGVEKLKASGGSLSTFTKVEYQVDAEKESILKFEYKTDGSGTIGDGGFYIDELTIGTKMDKPIILTNALLKENLPDTKYKLSFDELVIENYNYALYYSLNNKQTWQIVENDTFDASQIIDNVFFKAEFTKEIAENDSKAEFTNFLASASNSNKNISQTFNTEREVIRRNIIDATTIFNTSRKIIKDNSIEKLTSRSVILNAESKFNTKVIKVSTYISKGNIQRNVIKNILVDWSIERKLLIDKIVTSKTVRTIALNLIIFSSSLVRNLTKDSKINLYIKRRIIKTCVLIVNTERIADTKSQVVINFSTFRRVATKNNYKMNTLRKNMINNYDKFFTLKCSSINVESNIITNRKIILTNILRSKLERKKIKYILINSTTKRKTSIDYRLNFDTKRLITDRYFIINKFKTSRLIKNKVIIKFNTKRVSVFIIPNATIKHFNVNLLDNTISINAKLEENTININAKLI